ncbi:MAG: tetratricopeptide repeat protein, partial [Treponema sp.]|nr:tetratricopeptide repeat protein [Treponema sp.]
MGSIRELKKAFFPFFFLFILFPLFGQANVSAVSLSSEIFRLETLASGAPVNGSIPSPQARRDAFLALARLHRLSGNHHAALRAYEGALSIFPNDARALLDQGRFLISIGEYDRAAVAINALPRAGEFGIEGRYLAAKLEAF